MVVTWWILAFVHSIYTNYSKLIARKLGHFVRLQNSIAELCGDTWEPKETLTKYIQIFTPICMQNCKLQWSIYQTALWKWTPIDFSIALFLHNFQHFCTTIKVDWSEVHMYYQNRKWEVARFSRWTFCVNFQICHVCAYALLEPELIGCKIFQVNLLHQIPTMSRMCSIKSW